MFFRDGSQYILNTNQFSALLRCAQLVPTLGFHEYDGASDYNVIAVGMIAGGGSGKLR